MSDECGSRAVSAARASICSEVSGTVCEPLSGGVFDSRCGVFVTMEGYPDRGLRGCIGYPLPVMPLGEALDAATRAACHDPRFPDLSADETDAVTVEVTVLTAPYVADVPKEELPQRIEIGRHGLIITCGRRRALLLPQVPAEWGWDAEEYLENLSAKAGLQPDAWRRPDAVIEFFEGEIFHEVAPNGAVTRG